MILPCSLHTLKSWAQPPSHPPWEPKFGSVFPDIFPGMGQQGSERRAQAIARGKDGLKGQEQGYRGDVYLGCACRGRAQRQSSDIWKNQTRVRSWHQEQTQMWQSKQSSSGGTHHLFIDGIMFIVQCVNRPVRCVRLGEWKITIEL